jgi:peptidyl-prolyl cis-trans isomerase D
MTMLGRMRDHKNWLKWSLAIIIVAFVGFYAQDFSNTTTTPGGAPNDIVAQIEGRAITTENFRRVYYQQIQSYQAAYGGNIDEQVLRQLGIDRQILEQMIDEQAALVEAARLNLTVNDIEIRERVTSLPGLQEDGVFIGEARYRELLRSQIPPLTTPQFEESIRDSLLLEKLEGVLTQWIDISDDEVREEYRLRTEKVKLDMVTFSPDDYKTDVTVTDAELTEHLNNNAATYEIPDKRKIRFLAIEAESLRAEINVTPQEVETYYNTNLPQYSTPEQIRASHILFNSEGADEVALLAKAESVLAEARAGADFADLAEQHSDDTGSASLGGDLNYFGRGQMVPAFETAAFSLMPGEISDLVQTDFGLHIIKVFDKQEAFNRPLDEVRDQIADQLQWQRALDRASSVATELSNTLAGPDDLDRVALERGWEVKESNFFGRSEPIEGLGMAPGVASAAFEFTAGEVGGPLQTASGQVFLTVIDQQDAYAPELDEVREDVTADLTDIKAMDLARTRAAELTPQLQQATNFVATANRLRINPTATEFITRGTALPEVGQNEAIDEIVFALDVGATSDVLSTDDLAVVVHVVDREEITEDGLAAAKEALRAELIAYQQNRFFSAYMRKAKDSMAIEINQTTLAMAII